MSSFAIVPLVQGFDLGYRGQIRKPPSNLGFNCSTSIVPVTFNATYDVDLSYQQGQGIVPSLATLVIAPVPCIVGAYVTMTVVLSTGQSYDLAIHVGSTYAMAMIPVLARNPVRIQITTGGSITYVTALSITIFNGLIRRGLIK